jgi:hypothetical protein
MFFSSLAADESRELLCAAGLEIVNDEVIVQSEPDHGEVEFLWVLARRSSPQAVAASPASSP